MTDTTLTRADWIAAGLAHLAQPGTVGLTVAAMAAMLGATKGSFYWHFSGLPDLRLAVAMAYETACEPGFAPPPGASDPLAALLAGLLPSAGASEGGLRVLARQDAQVAAVMERIDRRRIGAIGAVLERSGAEAARTPRLIYAAWLGAAQLAGPLGIPADRLMRAATARLVARGRGAQPCPVIRGRSRAASSRGWASSDASCPG